MAVAVLAFVLTGSGAVHRQIIAPLSIGSVNGGGTTGVRMPCFCGLGSTCFGVVVHGWGMVLVGVPSVPVFVAALQVIDHCVGQLVRMSAIVCMGSCKGLESKDER